MTRNFKLENYNTQMKYDRYNFTSNLNLKPTSKTTVDLGFSGYLGQGHYPQSSTSSLYAACMDVNPVIYPLLLPNGTVSGINSQQKFNPYGLLARGGYYDEFSSQLNSNIRVKQDLDFWKWSKGLSASAMVAFDTYNSRKRKYNRNEPMYTFAGKTDENGIWIEDTLFDEETGDYLYSVLKEADGSLSLQTPEQWSSRTVYTEASLNYDRSFGAHRVGGLLLYNQKVYWDLNATDVIGGMPYKQRGFAGRATYSWNDRYFAEFNLGINGSENFSPGKRYGVFPAFGLGWAVSNESFWNPVRKYISFLKFRYTDGWVGSDTATGRRFMYQGVFTGLTGTMFGTNYTSANGYGEEKYGVNVTWSKSRKQDLGIDIKFLNDNLSFVVDFFKERRDNIFLQRSTIPSYAGWIENPYANLGVVENKGIELAMDYTQRLGKKTFLTVRGNLTFNKDKIIENDEPPVDYPWMETIVPGKAADFVGMDAGGIDDVFRFDSTLVRFDGFDGTVFYGNARDLTFTDDFSAVDDGIFSKSQSQTERPTDTGSRSPERAFDVLADIRFFFAHFIAADDFQSGNAIGIAPFEEFLEDVHLFVVESGYIRAGPADVQIQFVFQFMIHRIACDIHAGFHTTRRRIETCVKDGTVGLCRAGSQFRFLFNQDCTKIVLCQFVQNGCAGNTAANYDDICLFCHVHNLFLCKYQVSLSLMPLLYRFVKIIARLFLHIFT